MIAGGLVAGLIMNILDMTWNFTVLAADMKAMVDQLRLDPAVLDGSFVRDSVDCDRLRAWSRHRLELRRDAAEAGARAQDRDPRWTRALRGGDGRPQRLYVDGRLHRGHAASGALCLRLSTWLLASVAGAWVYKEQ